MGAIAILWVVGIIAYFVFTDERQREQNLVWMWAILFAPAVIYPIMRLLGL